MPLRLLLVEDMPAEAELVVREFARYGIACDWRRVDTEQDLIREIAALRPHVIVSDFSLPRFDGLSALLSAPETRPGIVGIVIGSTFKGLIVGLLIGIFAKKERSLAAVLIFGVLVSAFFAYLVHQAKGDVQLAVAGYYQGLRSVRQKGMQADTKRYVANVMALRQRFSL